MRARNSPLRSNLALHGRALSGIFAVQGLQHSSIAGFQAYRELDKAFSRTALWSRALSFSLHSVTSASIPEKPGATRRASYPKIFYGLVRSVEYRQRKLWKPLRQ